MAIRSIAWSGYRDENLRMALGMYPSLTYINVFGRNRNCADGTEEEITSIEAALSVPATALMTRISQTTDQSANRGKTLEIIGVDNSFDEVTQTVTLDGSLTTTAVALTTALRRVNSIKMTSDTLIDSTVRLHNTAESQDYGILLVGEDRITQAKYTVPNNKTAFMTNWWGTRNNTADDTADTVDFQLYELDNGNSLVQQLVESLMIDPATGTYVPRQFSPYRKFTEQTDILITATAASTVADVSAGFDLILIDDNDN